jgi:hypothetical protein
MDVHWLPQSQFCGLSSTLQHYNTVEQLFPETVRFRRPLAWFQQKQFDLCTGYSCCLYRSNLEGNARLETAEFPLRILRLKPPIYPKTRRIPLFCGIDACPSGLLGYNGRYDANNRPSTIQIHQNTNGIGVRNLLLRGWVCVCVYDSCVKLAPLLEFK